VITISFRFADLVPDDSSTAATAAAAAAAMAGTRQPDRPTPRRL